MLFVEEFDGLDAPVGAAALSVQVVEFQLLAAQQGVLNVGKPVPLIGLGIPGRKVQLNPIGGRRLKERAQFFQQLLHLGKLGGL